MCTPSHLLRPALRALILSALTIGLALPTSACANKNKKTRDGARRTVRTVNKRDPVDMDGADVDPNSPCDNPDWVDLPPGMRPSGSSKDPPAGMREELESPKKNDENTTSDEVE